MSIENFIKKILSSFRKLKLKQDMIAGLTVSVVGISSSMAYAAIAGVNPIYGLYAAIVPAIIGSLFSSSGILITGPTNATALVTASILIGLSIPSEHYLDMVFALAIISGLIKLLLGVLNMGSILRFVSASVLAGFMSAVGLLIALGQIGNLTGLSIPKNDGVIVILKTLFSELGRINVWVLVAGLLTSILIIVLKNKAPKLPAAFLGIVIVSFFVEIFGLHESGIRQVCDLNLPSNTGLNFYIPKVNLTEVIALLPGAAALAIFSLVEAVSTAKSFSGLSSKPLNVSKEFRAQGLASLFGGFFMAIPSSGSPSRSAVNYAAGAKSSFSGMFSGIFLFVILLLFSGWIGYIALPSLAAAIVISGLGLINFDKIHIVWNSSIRSRIIFIGTFLATLFMPLYYSVYVGVGLSILLHMLENSEVYMTYIVPLADGGIVEKEIDELKQERPAIAVINIQGDLDFNLIENMEDKLRMIVNSDLRFLILRLRRVNKIGSTGIVALEKFIHYAANNDVEIILCGLQPSVRDSLEMSGIEDLVGCDCSIDAGEKIYDSMYKAIRCAEQRLSE